MANHLLFDKFILGTVQFGKNYGVTNQNGQTSKIEVYKMLDYALEKGITKLDSSTAYGNAHQVLGDYPKIKEFKIFTKFVLIESPLLEKAILDQLSILKSSQIEGLSFHSFKEYLNDPKLAETLVKLKELELIKTIGVSLYTDELKSFISSDLYDLVSFIQSPVNTLIYPKISNSLNIISANKKIQARSIWLQGILATEEGLPSKFNAISMAKNKLIAISKELNIPLRNLCLFYVLNRTPDFDIVVGTTSLEELKQLCESVESFQPIQNQILNEIDSISKEIEDERILDPRFWN